MTRTTSVRRRLGAGLVATALAAGLASTATAPAAAAAPGERSLAEVLTSDGNHFDRDNRDYDIVTEAVLAVIDAREGDTPVALLADGSTPLTAFVPRDKAFKALVRDLTGRWYYSEKRAFKKLVEAVGIDNVEKVLLYHVVPGATIDSAAALQADGVPLTTAEGGSFTVDVMNARAAKVRLLDNDPDDFNPWLVRNRLDINKGNQQIAHGISRVLRPFDL